MANDWQHLTPYGVPLDGATAVGAGGTPSGFRSDLDARRSVAGRTPDAEYPDGYLGNVGSRREDRLLSAVQNRLTGRSYQRGVHKGDKIGSEDYFWPANFNPESGLQAQAAGVKWTAIGSTPVEQINHMGKNHMLSPEELSAVAGAHNVNSPTLADPIRQERMRHLLPSWSA